MPWWAGWWEPDPRPSRQLRIGDAERDATVSALGDHFAAGRLTRVELDERVDRAMQARVQGDLAPLLADLPPLQPAAPPPHARTPAFGPGLWLLFPVAVLAVVAGSAMLHGPWLLVLLIWMSMAHFAWRRSGRGGGFPRRDPRWR